MPFLSLFCCGPNDSRSPPVPPIDSPTPSLLDKDSPNTGSPSLKRFPTVSSRPTEENFQLPEKSFSFSDSATVRRCLSFEVSSYSKANGSSLSRRRTSGNSAHSADLSKIKAMDKARKSLRTQIGKEMERIKSKWEPSERSKAWYPASLGRDLFKNEEFWANVKKYVGTDSTLKEFLRRDAPQLFVMLIHTKNDNLIKRFHNSGKGDALFPVEPEDSTFIKPLSNQGGLPQRVELGDDLDPVDMDHLFENLQWRFFVPELLWAPFEQPSLHSESRLPFLKSKHVKRTEFSTVYQRVVHRDHISLRCDGLAIAKDESGNPFVAVKQLHSIGGMPEASKSFFQAEHETLSMLRDFETIHLIKAAAFYKQAKGSGEEDIVFVFPWAERGNLREFWKGKSPSIYENHYMEWVFKQLMGLADAILTLHAESDRNCRHGDLKPENVLCFNSPGPTSPEDHTSCVLVISDVGLARTHDVSTQLRSRTKMAAGETIAYAAPETELFPDRATSRRYDIWSFGCLCLEFVIWLLFGPEELERFGKEVGRRFYVTAKTDKLQVEGDKEAQISPDIKGWIKHIKEDPRCAKVGEKKTAIGRLVELVEERLLVVKVNPQPKELKTMSGGSEGEDTTTSTKVGSTPVKIQVRAATMLRSNDQKRSGSQMPRVPVADKDERAYAHEVYDSIVSIHQDAQGGRIGWLNHGQGNLKERFHSGPSLAVNSTTGLPGPSALIKQEVSTENAS